MSVNPQQQTNQTTPESGLRFDRALFVREENAGETPTDPEWQYYSDRVFEVEGEPDAAIERLEQTGSADPIDFGRGIEENELTVSYSLQHPIVDVDGEPVDPSYDGWMRNAAQQVPNTHTFVGRDNNPSPGPHDPEGCEGQRQYMILRGAKPNVEIEPDVEEPDPIPVALTYSAQKLRAHLIYQPAEPSTVAVVSDAEEDDDITITIESEDGEQSEELELDGTTPVVGEIEFEDVDVFHASEPAEGDVELLLGDGDGPRMSVLVGGNTYAADGGIVEGDQGVPPTGEGSMPDPVHEQLDLPLAQSFERFEGHVWDFDFYGDAPHPDLNNITIEVDNDFEARGRQTEYTPAIEEANREIELDADVVGERVSYDTIRQAYLNRPSDIRIELTRTVLEFPNSRVTEPSSMTRESEDAFAENDVTWQGGSVEITHPDAEAE